MQEIELEYVTRQNWEMIGTVDPSFQRALDSLSSPGIVISHRLISPGDELALLAEEADSMVSRSDTVLRASGAARHQSRHPAIGGERSVGLAEANIRNESRGQCGRRAGQDRIHRDQRRSGGLPARKQYRSGAIQAKPSEQGQHAAE